MRKAQISMFVIIGAVLLLAAGLFFFINRELSQDKPVVDVPDVSLETRPAAQLIESCLESTAKLAIERVSAQGGYLSAPRPSIVTDKGSSVIMSPDTIPFWRYMDERNCDAQFGCPASERPPLCKTSSADRCFGYDFGDNSIEEQIDTYILDHIDDCIGGLVSLSDFYDVELSDEKSVEIYFKEGSTSFVLTNPLIASSRSTDNTQSLEQYRAVLDVDMLRMYDVATKTLKFLEETNFYEDKTMNLVTVYSCNEASCLPPTDDFSLSKVSSTFWIQQEAKTKMETEVLPLMNLISFINFDNYVLLSRPEGEDFGDYNPYIDGLYASFSARVGDERFTGYDLNQYYLYQPIKFQIDDGEEIIRPKPLDLTSLGVGKDLLPFGFADMRYNYFMTYPLVLSITDKNAFNGEGLKFNFAIEVNIAGNKPAYDNVTSINTGSTLGVGLNDIQNRVQREVTVSSFDRYTGEPLKDVVINYICIDEYEIGVTSLLADGSAQMTSTFPHCEVGGFISFSKEGYASDAIPFDNPEGSEDTSVSVSLWPIKER
ncbi:MAG: hypothetical protein KC535_03455, partial [Nanoarchaeota archaeon]|nr:hypothetical protein [Nanoarchaeota archaeon]